MGSQRVGHDCDWTELKVLSEKDSFDLSKRKSEQTMDFNQPWIFIGKADAKGPILWPPDAESQLIGKDSEAGKDWRQKEKRVAEFVMVR